MAEQAEDILLGYPEDCASRHSAPPSAINQAFKQAQSGKFWYDIRSLSPISDGKLERQENKLGRFVALLTQLGTPRKGKVQVGSGRDGFGDTLVLRLAQGAKEFFHGVHSRDRLLW